MFKLLRLGWYTKRQLPLDWSEDQINVGSWFVCTEKAGGGMGENDKMPTIVPSQKIQ